METANLAGQPVLSALAGPLDAHQRLAFLRWHMDHHREQLAAVRAGMPS